MLFNFSLTPLEKIIPWGEPGEEILHWFGLTDGTYWMEVGEHKLFEYSSSACESSAPEYCDYQIVRL